MKKLSVLSFVFVFGIAFACQKSTNNSKSSTITCDTSPTYTNDTKKIIDANCATSGCHSSGSVQGDFTTYSGLQPYLTSGDFYREVISNKTMPQGFSLSTSNYNTLYCWSKNNFAQ